MENKSPSSLANSALSRQSDASDERDLEIAKLKERLGFYESFDQIIQENVARAGDLLRHAVSVRENADEAVSSATKGLEQKRLSERQEQRALLSGLLDDVTTMQVHVERLARKVADALDDVEATLPAGPDLDFLPLSADAPVAALVAPVVGSHAELALDPTPEEIAPEDFATIAAREKEAHSPLAEETATIAAETREISDAPFGDSQTSETDSTSLEGSEVELPSEESPVTFETSSESETADIAVESADETDSVSVSELVENAESTVTDDDDTDRVDYVATQSIDRVDDDSPQTLIATFDEENSSDFLPELESIEVDEAELSESYSVESEARDSAESAISHTGDLPDSFPAFEDEPAAIDTLDVESGMLVSSFESSSVVTGESLAESGLLAESDIPTDEESFEALDHVKILSGNIRSLSTDELFLAPELSATEGEVEQDSGASQEPVSEDVQNNSVAESVEVATIENAQPDLGDDGVISSETITGDVADADAVIKAIELSEYQAAVPAALAEDPEIDAVLTQSIQHLAEQTSESDFGGVEPIENDDTFETEDIVAEAEIPFAPEAAAAVPDVRPFPAGGLGTAPRPSTAELRNAALARFTAPASSSGVRGIGTVVLVHGVPRATTALSLKRYLESLPHVSSVEPREYAEGILRLHVTADRSIHIDDLRGWSDGMGFEPVHLRDDLVEVRLPH